MFLDSPTVIPALAKATNFSIFALDPPTGRRLLETTYKTACLFLAPDEKTNKITIDMIREFLALAESRETSDRFFIVLSAETLNPAAANAFLKNLEEPNQFHHFVFFTPTPSALLPTVLSRAQLFYLKTKNSLTTPLPADEKVKTLAKQLIIADEKQLITLATEISKKKDNSRLFALSVVATAIDLLYKSYFLTSQSKFLKRLPSLLNLYENLSKNGHIKLHLVADML